MATGNVGTVIKDLKTRIGGTATALVSRDGLVLFADVPAGARPRRFTAKELIVLPAFHPLAGREALNRQRPRRSRSFLFGRFLGEGSARAYLLDGTDVGPIVTPASTRRSGSPRRARPAP